MSLSLKKSMSITRLNFKIQNLLHYSFSRLFHKIEEIKIILFLVALSFMFVLIFTRIDRFYHLTAFGAETFVQISG